MILKRFDVENAPTMRIGMGVEAALINGYKHGWENKVTKHICTLPVGSVEFHAWMAGYVLGEQDNEINVERAKRNKEKERAKLSVI